MFGYLLAITYEIILVDTRSRCQCDRAPSVLNSFGTRSLVRYVAKLLQGNRYTFGEQKCVIVGQYDDGRGKGKISK